MAFSAIIRRAASSVAPLAVRFVFGTQRTTSLKTSTVSQELCQRTFLRTLFNISSLTKGSSSDKCLLQDIESEIKCTNESKDRDWVEEIPDGFPFEIQDNPRQRTISLRRKYQGEIIKVEVQMPSIFIGDNGKVYYCERSIQSSLPLVVTVCKASELCLEFGCTAYSNEIKIDSLSVKEPEAVKYQFAYEGPDFSELDVNLQKAFQKYLEIRGIKPSNTSFLHEYMVNRDSKEYLRWLKNIKKFIEN